MHGLLLTTAMSLVRDDASPKSSSVPISLPTVSRMALFYGVAGFGGGYSVLAQLRRDLVDRRGWLTADEFLVLAELSKSLPGTPATNLITLLGYRVRGARGGLIAAGAFLLPSMMVMIGCVAAYSLIRSSASLGTFFDGMNAAMVGVVGAVTVDLGRAAIRSRMDLAVTILCALLLSLRIVSEPVVACAAVVIGGSIATLRSGASVTDSSENKSRSFTLPALLFGTGGAAGLAGLIRVFVPIGVLTFGGGLAMIPAIEHVVVSEQHWLGPKGFADAIALGQITPGPVAICATFIGYRVGGIVGAIVATIAMFGPATVLAMAAGHSVNRFRSSAIVHGALRALAPVVIGMLAAATFSLGRASCDSFLAAAVALVSFVALLRIPLSPLWFLAGGGLAHLIAVRLRA